MKVFDSYFINKKQKKTKNKQNIINKTKLNHENHKFVQIYKVEI